MIIHLLIHNLRLEICSLCLIASQLHSTAFQFSNGYLRDPPSITEVFTEAKLSQNREDIKKVFYPYKFNALHYFVIRRDSEGCDFAIDCGVKIIRDSKGKSPLDYAIQIGDKTVLTVLFEYIFDLTSDEREEIFKDINLVELIKADLPNFGDFIDKIALKKPNVAKVQSELDIPKLYAIQKGEISFGIAQTDLYSQKLVSQLHPKQSLLNTASNIPIETFVSIFKLPKSFSRKSITLLDHLRNSDDDGVLKSVLVTRLLRMKWTKFTRYAFGFQFIIYLVLLVLLTIIYQKGIHEHAGHTEVAEVAIVLNSFFLLYEIFTIIITGKQYFLDFMNYLDIARIYLVYHCLYYEIQRWDNWLGFPTLYVLVYVDKGHALLPLYFPSYKVPC